MRRVLVVILAVTLCLGLFLAPASAAQQVKVLIDDENINFNVYPIIKDGRTLVPVRKIVESMGGDVTWNPNNQTVKIVKDSTTVVLVIDSKIANVNEQDRILEVPATVINGRTLVPLRFVSEVLGAKLLWDANTWTIRISTPQNIDDEAFALFVKASEKSKDIKQGKFGLSGTITMAGMPELQNIKAGFEGDVKLDSNIPAFSFNGKFTFSQGIFSQDFNMEMVFKDNVIYFKDPITGRWQKEAVPEQDAKLFTEALAQNQSIKIDYQEFYNFAKETGAIKNLAFAGEKTINGIPTKGVYLEFNGLKIGKLLQKALSIYDDPEINEAIEQSMSIISFDKLKYTCWIGSNDNLIYGYDMDFRMNTSMGEGAAKEQLRIEMTINTTISDLNKPQDIPTPQVDDKPTTTPIN